GDDRVETEMRQSILEHCANIPVVFHDKNRGNRIRRGGHVSGPRRRESLPTCVSESVSAAVSPFTAEALGIDIVTCCRELPIGINLEISSGLAPRERGTREILR